MTQKFDEVVKVIAAEENIENPQLDYQYSSTKGDGYMGIINAMQLKGSKGKVLDLIFKQAPTNEKQREAMSTRHAFLHEIAFYEKVWKILCDFQEEFCIEKPFNNIPKCYATVSEAPNELLVLENLTACGYGMWNRQNLMDKDHFELVIRTYAKFQATVMALKAIKPNEYQRIKELLICEGGDILNVLIEKMGMFDEFDKLVGGLIDIFDKETEKHYYERFVQFTKMAAKIGSNVTNDGEHEVLCQGDAWCNNIMFLYGTFPNGNKVPVNAKIIDFQITYARPALMDLTYLFYANATKEAMDNLEHYLKVYHDAVAEHLSQFNLDVNNILPFDDLIRLWPKYAKYSLTWCIFIRKGMVCDPSEIPDLEKIAEEETKEAFLMKVDREDDYRQQLKEMFTHAIDRNFI